MSLVAVEQVSTDVDIRTVAAECLEAEADEEDDVESIDETVQETMAQLLAAVLLPHALTPAYAVYARARVKVLELEL